MRIMTKRVTAFLLTLALLLTIPVIPGQAAEILEAKITPREGNFELEFGFQTTQYVNINIYAKAANDPGGAFIKYVLAEDYLLTGAGDMTLRLDPEDSMGSGPRAIQTDVDPSVLGITPDGLYTTEVDFAGDPIPPTQMMKNILLWDCTVDGYAVVGPDMEEDQFIIVMEIEPQGRPDWSSSCTGPDGDPSHVHGDDYTWPQDPQYKIQATLLINYREFIESEDGSGAPDFLSIKGGFSDQVEELSDLYFSGSMTCSDLTNFPELTDAVMDYSDLDPVDMVTGAYQSVYTDLRLESAVPLTFFRAYHSRYEGGSLGTGFTHSYEYSLREDRNALVRITMPGGEEQVFLRLNPNDHSQDFKSLQGSDFTLHNDGMGYRMHHIDGADLYFNAAGQFVKGTNPDGLNFTMTYDGGGRLTQIAGPAGQFTLDWDLANNVIESVTDSAGRTVFYEHSGKLLTAVRNPDGDTQRFTYENDYLTEVTDFEEDTYLINTYDTLGRVTKQQFWNADQELTATIH